MYHQFRDTSGSPYGSFEVWIGYLEEWFWWPCFPGCLPDSEPNGPFESEDEAVIDAMEGEG
jgi:hypothetical protein